MASLWKSSSNPIINHQYETPLLRGPFTFTKKFHYPVIVTVVFAQSCNSINSYIYAGSAFTVLENEFEKSF